MQPRMRKNIIEQIKIEEERRRKKRKEYCPFVTLTVYTEHR
jgi:hypothetical protein